MDFDVDMELDVNMVLEGQARLQETVKKIKAKDSPEFKNLAQRWE